MGEFELIRHFFYPVADATDQPGLILGPGDDCAVQRVPKNTDLVFSIDTLVEGVHFPENYEPTHLGWRCLAVAASDLAAAGADPVCFTLALTLPEPNEHWLEEFSTGLKQAATRFGLALAGGDTTRGPLSVTVQVHGTVPEGQEIRRAGAKPGDLICVSGTLGEAGAALAHLQTGQPDADQLQVLQRYHHPEPRLALGVALRSRVSAAVDVSDGLLADLQHILTASCVRGVVDATRLPISKNLRALRSDAVSLALNAGDDYELCVTISPDEYDALPDTVSAQLTVIGSVHTGEGVSVSGQDDAGATTGSGYDHFRS